MKNPMYSVTILSFSSFHGLVVRGWGLCTDRVFSLSSGLAQRAPNDNNNNNNVILFYWFQSVSLLQFSMSGRNSCFYLCEW